MTRPHDETPDIAPTPPAPRARIGTWLLGFILLILSGWALRMMSPVVVPLLFALFLTIVLFPLDRHLAALLPRGLAWLGRVLTMGVLLLGLALFTSGIAFSAQRLLQRLPDVSDRISAWLSTTGQAREKAHPAAEAAGGIAPSRLIDDLSLALRDGVGSLGSWAVNSAASFAEALIGATGGLMATLVIVFFLVLLGLSEARLWIGKIDSLCDGTSRAAWRDTLNVIASRLRWFMLVRAGVGLLTAAIYAAWLTAFGMDLVPVWAILAFLLSFIPNLGSIISGSFPFFYALATRDVTTALAIGGGLFVVEQTIGNVLDPRLQGRQIVLSPIVILVSLLFWGWLWGVAGALLAVPMSIAVLAICNNISALRPVALMLSNQRSHQALDTALS